MMLGIPWGFGSWKEILEVVGVPLVLVLLGSAWPLIQQCYRRRAFTRLILRELQELTPFPDKPVPGGKWWEHHKRSFVHQRIFSDVTNSRDFVLSLNPTLVYWVTQLWDSLARHDSSQWLWYLGKIAETHDRNGEMKKCLHQWRELIGQYEQVAKGTGVTPTGPSIL